MPYLDNVAERNEPISFTRHRLFSNASRKARSSRYDKHRRRGPDSARAASWGWHWPVLCKSLDGNLIELITCDAQFISKVLLVLFCMNRDLVLSRSRSSRRVRRLSASAIRVAVYECCAQTVDPIAAELLARHLTATDAVERFRRQAEIPRRSMSRAQLAIYRTYVVAKETIEDASRTGTPVELHDRELLKRVRTTQETISSMRKMRRGGEGTLSVISHISWTTGRSSAGARCSHGRTRRG